MINEKEIRKIVIQIVERFENDPTAATGPSSKAIAIGADHGGFEIKEKLIPMIKNLDYNVINVGCYSKDSVDYPDIAQNVCKEITMGKATFGVIIDGAGIGSTMAANKISGIRAALCYNDKTIINSRSHNNANVLCLGAAFHSADEAFSLIKLWLNTAFEGGRHLRRVDKIMKLECAN
jgi:ribose 5-phosphate isomerase B